MATHIELPNETDMHKIAALLACAGALAEQLLHESLDTSEADLPRLQQLVDSQLIPPEESLGFQALGMAFGQVFAAQNPGYDWWMIDDDNGRDPCLRFRQTSVILYPQTLLSKRIEAGEAVDIVKLYRDIQQQLSDAAANELPDTQ